MERETKPFRFESRKDAQTAAKVGRITWVSKDADRSLIGNLHVVESATVPVYNVSFDGYVVDITFRPATPEEFRKKRIAWLEKEASDLGGSGLCEWGNHNPNSRTSQYREQVAAMKAEIAQLQGVAA